MCLITVGVVDSSPIEDEFNAVTSTRLDEERQLALETNVSRSKWILLLAAAIVDRCRKFNIVPDMVMLHCRKVTIATILNCSKLTTTGVPDVP